VTDDVADGVNERAHEQVRAVLPDYVLGALSLDLADEVGQHIAFCPSCQQLFETMVGSLALLGPLEIPAAAVKERLFARIGDHQRRRDVVAPRRSAAARLHRAVAGA